MILILIFIFILNVVAIALTYHCLSNMDQKEKVIFIAVGIAIIYALTSVAYWISTKDVAVKEVSETSKNLITFLFVPINALIVLPLIAKSYNKYKTEKLGLDKLRNRGILLGIILIIVLAWECSYFKDIQDNIIMQLEQTSKKQENTGADVTNNIENQITNELENNMEQNVIENKVQF